MRRVRLRGRYQDWPDVRRMLRQLREVLHGSLVQSPAHRAELLCTKRLAVGTDEHGPSDFGAQFADVSRPVVPQKEIQGGPTNPANGPTVVSRGLPCESEYEFRNIFPAVAQRGNVKLQPSEPVVEIGAKVPLFGEESAVSYTHLRAHETDSY